jgi:hypothetical protein
MQAVQQSLWVDGKFVEPGDNGAAGAEPVDRTPAKSALSQ